MPCRGVVSITPTLICRLFISLFWSASCWQGIEIWILCVRRNLSALWLCSSDCFVPIPGTRINCCSSGWALRFSAAFLWAMPVSCSGWERICSRQWSFPGRWQVSAAVVSIWSFDNLHSSSVAVAYMLDYMYREYVALTVGAEESAPLVTATETAGEAKSETKSPPNRFDYRTETPTILVHGKSIQLP